MMPSTLRSCGAAEAAVATCPASVADTARAVQHNETHVDANGSAMSSWAQEATLVTQSFTRRERVQGIGMRETIPSRIFVSIIILVIANLMVIAWGIDHCPLLCFPTGPDSF